MRSRLDLMDKVIIDSAAWTGRAINKPIEQPPRFQDDLSRIAAEHGVAFASRVATSYNTIWKNS